jgi:hypothetical protein
VRVIAIGIAIGLLVFLVTRGHVVFLPLVFLPFAFLGFGRRRRRGTSRWP